MREVAISAARMVETPFELKGVGALGRGVDYDRLLLHEDQAHGFVVIGMLWPPGVKTPVHDHGTWGVVAVHSGQLRITSFDVVDEEFHGQGTMPILVPRRTLCAGPGVVDVVNPDDSEIHSIENPTGGPSVSLHTYGVLMTRHHVYDLEGGSRTLKSLRPAREP